MRVQRRIRTVQSILIPLRALTVAPLPRPMSNDDSLDGSIAPMAIRGDDDVPILLRC